MPSSFPTRSPNVWAYFAVSSKVIFEMGTNGQTSVAPKRGCAPLCLLISINSDAFLMSRKAASITGSGAPTKVMTVLFVAFPGSTSNKVTPSTVFTISEIALIFAASRPSLIFGTHSINCFCIIILIFFKQSHLILKRK